MHFASLYLEALISKYAMECNTNSSYGICGNTSDSLLVCQ